MTTVSGKLAIDRLRDRGPLDGAAVDRFLAGTRSLLLQSGSFVFTDSGHDHGGGPAFEPVVRFMNRYRASPRRVADRLFVSCGIFEPLIVPNRAMVPVFEGAGMAVRYVEARDGHSWENWRDRLRDGLSWIFPGRQQFHTSEFRGRVFRG